MQNLAEMVAARARSRNARCWLKTSFLSLKEMIPKLERQIQISFLPKDEADEKNAILEVRAGTGGDEAALFATNLFPHVSTLRRTAWLAL